VNFPEIAPEQWGAVQARFLASIEALADAADQADTAAEYYKGRSLGWFLVNQALHNSYHLAQVVTMRRQLGVWPPPGL
jgi:hypothetical protein